MALLRAHTYIQDVTIPGGGTLAVAHNVQTNSGIALDHQIISITPINAGGVGTWLSAINGNEFTLNKAGGGDVRVQVQAVHSIQE